MSHTDPGQELTPLTISEESPDTIAKYRCVCGQIVEMNHGTAKCDACHRKYTLKQDQESDQTVVFVPKNKNPDEQTTLQLSNRSSKKIDDKNDPLIGKKLGHFKILSCLGGGGMGKVYRAFDESLQRYVALKVILASTRNNTQSDIQLLFQEARAQARLNHPHVAHIYYVGNENEIPFLAMELVGTQTLADRIKSGPLRFDETIRYTLQIAMALDQAARFDIVHGDVKPANVLLVDDKEKTIKLSDFGMARRISELKGTSNTISGTPNYIPPEATLGEKPDHRGDMYSLGITLFEMSFGRLPYHVQGKSLSERLKAHRKASIEFPEVWPSQLPTELRQIIEKLLAKSPKDRYEDFSKLISDLKKIEPVSLPTARPLLRGLAWLFDSFLIFSIMMLLTVVLPTVSSSLFLFAFTETTRIALTCLFLLGIGTFQGWRGTTPGKSLFQIRIVDRNGLRPGKSVLAPRTIFQFLWAWGVVATDLLMMFNLQLFSALTTLGVVMFILIETGFVLFGKGLSFHDRLLHTRVTLDATNNERQ